MVGTECLTPTQLLSLSALTICSRRSVGFAEQDQPISRAGWAPPASSTLPYAVLLWAQTAAIDLPGYFKTSVVLLLFISLTHLHQHALALTEDTGINLLWRVLL